MSCTFSRAGEAAGEQDGDVAELAENLLEVEAVLRRQDFGGRQHRHLVAVFDGDHRRLRRHDGLAAAHVALQQPVHRMRRRHVVGDLPQHALLRAGRLERQHGLDPLAHAVVELEGDARDSARLAALQRHAALQPEELLEDQAELRRRAERVEQAQVAIRRREVDVADGASSGPASSGGRAGIAGSASSTGVDRVQNAVHQGAEHRAW